MSLQNLRQFRCLCLLVASAVLTAPAIADSLFIGTVERDHIHITGYRNGYIEFSVNDRSKEPVPADKVSHIALDGEADFNKAEVAFHQQKWEQAAASYQQALPTANKPWIKDYLLPRLVESANRSGQLEPAVLGFSQLVTRNLQQAIPLRPPIPTNVKPEILGRIATQLASQTDNPQLDGVQKLALLSVLLDIRQAQGDVPAAGRVADQISAIAAVDATDPAIRRLLGDIHLGLASLALAQTNPARAVSEIESNTALFATPYQQLQAAYCLAYGRDGMLGQKGNANQWRDLAIDYMRVVAAARASGQRRYVPESLMRVAQIQEQLGDLKGAVFLYAEVASEYKNEALSDRAQKECERLQGKTGN